MTSFFPAANCHADTFQRLTRDLSALIKDPVPGVFALPDPNNLLQVDMSILRLSAFPCNSIDT